MRFTSRRWILPAALAAVAGLIGATPAEAATPAGQITVLTQNQYLGADLHPVLTAQDQPAFQTAIRKALGQIADNKFQVRALGLALQIVTTKPDVVALQEVFDIQRNGAHAAGPYRDHLADTMAALKLLGGQYEVAAEVRTFDTTFPVDLDKNGSAETQVRLTDRDVLLVRKGIVATPVPFPTQCARPSLDGCKYQIAAPFQTPNGSVFLDRGLVGVDLSVNGRDYRIVNTQFEARDVDPTDPLSPSFQSMQAQELVTLTEKSEPGDRTVIVLGDLASRPEDELIVVGSLPMVPARHRLITTPFSFKDAWELDPNRSLPGNTCCQAGNLRNPKSQLDRRTDAIFVTPEPVQVRADVLGDSPLERLLLGRWPSDHGTLYARLRY